MTSLIAAHLNGTGSYAWSDYVERRPGADQVVLKLHARSLNFRDVLIRNGRYAIPAIPGVVALADGAGEVVALGERVDRVTLGDRVVTAYFPRWIDGPLSTRDLALEQFGCTRDGTLAPFVVAPAQALVKSPSHLSFEEAATLPCAALTAWSALTGPRPILPGETVLTIGTGGVSLFAVQFAQLFGARVLAITSTDEKVDFLKNLGADYVINYRSTPAWEIAVRDATGGRGVDRVVELGGSDTLPKSLKSIATGGEVALVAVLSAGTIDVTLLGSNAFTLRRVFVGSRGQFEAMNRAIELHRVRPVIDRVFPFEAAEEAYEHFAAARHLGKVVITGP